MSNPNSNVTSIPSAAQLAETRLKQWHQQGEALLTIENLRAWINATGLVLFAPRLEIASPAPSLVEAVLGASNPTPTLAQIAEARGLLARLVAEGLAVPLNLLGTGPGTVHAGAPGDTPDFVASTAVFSYVFTLRGDKAWKQPPTTSGPTKVSNLALATYEALGRRGPMSAYDLSTEVGKEVTEAAMLRALAELWTHLRVIPLAQPDDAATLWELTSARFTKQIKAGANAGQPSALSALISLYLGQAVVAAEDEVESFLSPLAPRSRIRDVIHALVPSRQLETIAVEGRTVLHVAGTLPAFLNPEEKSASEESGAQDAAGVELEAEDGESRIKKFVPKPRKIGTGYLAKAKPSKFAAKPAGDGGARPRTGFKGGLGAKFRGGPAPERERRPFRKPAAGGFDKPWDEEKARKLAAIRKPSEVPETGDAGAPEQPRAFKPRTEGRGDRKSFGGKPAYGGKSSFRGEGRPPRRESSGGEGAGDRPPRKTFSKPGTFGRKREGGFAPRSSGEGRPPRREFTPRPQGEGRPPRREFSPRPQGDRPPRREFTPRPQGDRPRGDRPFGDRPRRTEGGDFAARKPYSDRPRGGKPGFVKRDRPSDAPREGGFGGDRPKPVYRKFDAPRDRPARPYSSDRPARAEGERRRPEGDFPPRKFKGGASGKPKFGGKPGGYAGKSSGKPGGFAGKRRSPEGSSSGKPAGTFAKFAGNKKPFGKRPPGRKFKPGKGE